MKTTDLSQVTDKLDHKMLVVIGTDCTCSCKSNYHTITTTTIPDINIQTFCLVLCCFVLFCIFIVYFVLLMFLFVCLFFFCFLFILALCLVCPTLTVGLVCAFLIAPSVLY